MTPLLDVRQLTRRYGAFTALRDLDFTLERREVLGFLGPNGAGKSTCLRVLTGNLAPHAGQVRIQGIDLWQEPLRAKTHVGYLPEQPPLYLNQRVDEYLEYSARLHRVPRGELTSALNAAKRRCGLQTVGRKLIRTLSKGYRQRVGIAQAILHRPDLIVLDEPTVGLDPIQIREIRDLIRELGQERGVLLSTHILPEVYSVCSRVLILHRGRAVHASAIDPDADAGGMDSLKIHLERPPAVERLRLLPKVNAVEDIGDGRFLLHLEPGAQPADIARFAVEAGWGLRELTLQRPSLEQVLVELTAQEDVA
jgi:ABC-2 type transport system ATP-binding protein